jgi:predicted  nucleic acid-binding Zn-ribbon protein
VPLEIFELFLKALETGGKVRVTNDNASAISLLAKEFWLEDLLSECSALQIASTPEPIAALSVRISKLERQISSQSLPIIAELKESIVNHNRQLESLSSGIEANSAALRTDIGDLRHYVQLLQTKVETVKSKCERPNEAFVAHVASVEGKMSETLSPIPERLSVCETGPSSVCFCFKVTQRSRISA